MKKRVRWSWKKPLRPRELIGEGVVQCLKNAAGRLGVRLSDLLKQTEVFKIGTTSPVNRLINRAGAKTALITTKGHEDAIIIGRLSQKTDRAV